jgi:acetyl esterase/lipase
VTSVAIMVVGAGALAVRRYATMRDALAAVAPELRNPLLPFVPPTDTATMLPLFRLNSRVRTPSGPGVAVTKRRIPGDPEVPVLVTTPEPTSPNRRAAVLWIHGGGYVVGSPRLEALGTGRVAREVGAVVVSPDYRLAPQHPFPAALDDCMATLRSDHGGRGQFVWTQSSNRFGWSAYLGRARVRCSHLCGTLSARRSHEVAAGMDRRRGARSLL